MKRKNLLLSVAFLTTALSGLIGCGDSGDGKSTVITLWVGEESTTFYQNICDQYVADHPDFGFTVKAVGTNAGANGGAMVDDNSKCGDIVTVAHDNIGKLIDKNKILPITEESLIAQVDADNPESFKTVINYVNDIGEGSKSYLYGVPYISQALILYYNKLIVTDPNQAKTFEGLMQAAKNAGEDVKAFTIDGADGYNYSFNLLARKASDNSTTLRLYENFNRKNCYCQGDDEVASLRWAQRVFNLPNGGMMPTDSGWTTTFSNGKVASVIAGAWRYDAAAAIGTSNLGISLIPTYTLTASDVEDTTMDEGTVMQGGTFADCKVFVINERHTYKYDKAQELIKYLSSKEVQLQSFVNCKNVPAYADFVTDVETVKDQVHQTVYDLAKAQLAMAEFGMPQPFINGTLNGFYFSKNAPDQYKNCVLNETGDFSTVRAARETLYKMNHIWIKGILPSSIPEVLPADIS